MANRGNVEPGGELTALSDTISVSNEFTEVRVRKVGTKQGERLELRLPKTGGVILLDAMQLEIVAAQDPRWFSELFEAAFGVAKDRD